MKYMTYCCWRAVTTRAHTEQLAIVDFLIRLWNGQLLSTILSYIHVSRRSLCGNYRARATLVPWTTEMLVWAAVADSHDPTLFYMCSEQHTACALLFTLFSAQFLVHFLSDGDDRGLRVRVIILLRQYGFDVCLFVCLWRVDCLFVTSRLRDELTGWRVDLWRVDCVTSWPGDELTVWRVDWQPRYRGCLGI